VQAVSDAGGGAWRALKQRIKGMLAARGRRQRAALLQQTAPHVTRADLAAGLTRLGVQPGDTLFIHSSLKSLGFVEGGPASVIGALQDAVGADGTLLLPTYWLPGGTILATCELSGYVFDVRQHGSNMGALPAAFLAMPGVQRSVHPTHSVSALGRHAAWVTAGHHQAPTVFGPGSPWQRFSELPRAKVLGLGVSMGPITFYHLVEDHLGSRFPVPVWADKAYTLPCIDAEGKRWTVPVRAYRPELMPQRIDHALREDLRQWFAAEFDSAGLRTLGLVGQAQAWTVDAQPFLQHLVALAQEGITIYSPPAALAARAPGSRHG
jgi:aminoglycoside 3-N-acetyltransferase